MPTNRKLILSPAFFLAVLLHFVFFSKAAHDIWAATLTYGVLLLLFIWVLLLKDEGNHSDLNIYPWIGALPAIGVFYASTWFSVNKAEAFSEWSDHLFAAIAFFISTHIFKKQQNRAVFLWAMLPFFPLQFAILFIEKLTVGWMHAPAGTIINSNLNAAFHLFWVPVLMSHWLQLGISKPKQIAFGISVFSCLASLLLLQSSSAIVWVLCYILWESHKGSLSTTKLTSSRLKKWISVMLIIVVVVLVAVQLFQLMKGHEIGSTFRYTNRLIWWQSAWAMFVDHPWLGIGLGNYPSAYLAYKVGIGQHTLFPHNILLGYLAETGLLGTLCVLIFFSYWISHAKAMTANPETRSYFWGALLVMSYCLINVGIEYFGILMLLGIFFGLCLSGVSLTAQWRFRRLWRICLIACLIGATPYFVAPFLASQNVVEGFRRLKLRETDDSVRQLFERAIELDPKSYAGYYGLAKFWGQRSVENKSLERLETAINNQLQAINRNSLSAVLWWELASYFEAAGDVPNAQQAYARAAQYDRTMTQYAKDSQRLLQKEEHPQ